MPGKCFMLHGGAFFVHCGDVGGNGARQPFGNLRQREKERVIQRRVDTKYVFAAVGTLPDKLRNSLFGVVNLPEQKKVIFAGAPGEPFDGAAKFVGKLRRNKLQRVNSKAVYVRNCIESLPCPEHCLP